MKTNSITLVFYNSLVEKTNCWNTAVFQSFFSFYLILPPCLNEHRFRHNFKNCINPLCSCSLELENTLHFFLHCLHCSTFCISLVNKAYQIDTYHLYLSVNIKVSLLLYGDSIFDGNKNNFILSASITYILGTESFSTSLFQSDVWILILA